MNRLMTCALLALSACATFSAKGSLAAQRRGALGTGFIPGLDEFDLAGREPAFRGIYQTLAVGSSIAPLELRFGPSFRLEMPFWGVFDTTSRATTIGGPLRSELGKGPRSDLRPPVPGWWLTRQE